MCRWHHGPSWVVVSRSRVARFLISLAQYYNNNIFESAGPTTDREPKSDVSRFRALRRGNRMRGADAHARRTEQLCLPDGRDAQHVALKQKHCTVVVDVARAHANLVRSSQATVSPHPRRTTDGGNGPHRKQNRDVVHRSVYYI